KRTNSFYDLKCARVAEAIHRREWEQFVWLYTRPYRIDALYELLHNHKLDLDRLWPLVASVWRDSENIRQSSVEWREIWSYPTRRRKLVMSIPERDRLRKLPDKIRIWRGFSHDDAARGFSWTLDRDTACFFSSRFAHGDSAP